MASMNNEIVLGFSVVVLRVNRVRHCESALGIDRDNKKDRVVSDSCMSSAFTQIYGDV